MFFTDEDFQKLILNNLMVITVEIAEYVVMKTLVDQGSFVDILFWETFRKLHLKKENMIPYREQIIGFSDERVDTKEYIDLETTFRRRSATKTFKMYLVVDACTSYNTLKILIIF